MDESCTLILWFLFNPVVTSQRGLQQASELKKAQQKLGCPKASLGRKDQTHTPPNRLRPLGHASHQIYPGASCYLKPRPERVCLVVFAAELTQARKVCTLPRALRLRR